MPHHGELEVAAPNVLGQMHPRIAQSHVTVADARQRRQRAEYAPPKRFLLPVFGTEERRQRLADRVRARARHGEEDEAVAVRDDQGEVFRVPSAREVAPVGRQRHHVAGLHVPTQHPLLQSHHFVGERRFVDQVAGLARVPARS